MRLRVALTPQTQMTPRSAWWTDVTPADVESAEPPRDAEATAVQFFPVGDLPEPLFAPDRPVLADYVSHRARPIIG